MFPFSAIAQCWQENIAMKLLIIGLFLACQIFTRADHPLVRCETTKGPLVIEVRKDWAPQGAKRFLDLVADNFFTNIALYRCVKDFLVQFGITDNPAKKHWHHKTILDDPNQNLGIHTGYVSFAGRGPNTRSTQMFIAFRDLDFLGKAPWETPFGIVVEGKKTLDLLYKEYGDIPPFGKGPDQEQIHKKGNKYIKENFPKTDFILSCGLAMTQIDETKLVGYTPPHLRHGHGGGHGHGHGGHGGRGNGNVGQNH